MPQATDQSKLEKQAAADAALFNDVTLPVLAEVAQARGYTLRNQEEVDSFLKVAAHVERAQAQQAAAVNPILKKAAAAIGGNQSQGLDPIISSLSTKPELRSALVAAR
jgi:hypothetical protein